MAWFKVDDRLHSHRKARKARRTHPEKIRDASPFGLWVLAGSWCGQSGTNGFVPMEILLDFDDDAELLAKRLVDADLFIPDTQDGEDGFWFHDYEERNPVEMVDPGVWGNHLRWHIKRKVTNPDCPHCIAPDIGAIRGDASCDSGRSSPPESSPDPTRPDPTRPEPVPNREKATPDRFDEFWEIYDKRVGKKAAEAKYRLALKKPGVTPELLMRAASDYIAYQRSQGKHPEFTKNPTTWLNGEHWTDERPAPRPAQNGSKLDGHVALINQIAAEEAEQQRQIGAS